MTDQSSKGKGNSNEWDYQSFQSLSLSDYADFSTPRGNPMDFSSTPAQAPMGQTYTQSTNYVHDANGLGQTYADFLSQSPEAMMATDVRGGSDPSVRNSGSSTYSSQNWDTLSHSSTSHRSIASANTSFSSATSVSSAPSRFSDVDTHIHRMGPPRQRYQLPCEFGALGCARVFAGDEQAEWISHTESHLGGTYPSKVKCWFCDDFGLFDAKNAGGDNRYNFHTRMHHIRDHILAGEYRLEDMRPDGFLTNHMKKQGVINEQGYQNILMPARVPAPAPVGGSNHQHHHRGSHRPLPPVVEEAGPSSSSGSRDRRSEKKADKKREHTRDSHHHHKKRSAPK